MSISTPRFSSTPMERWKVVLVGSLMTACLFAVNIFSAARGPSYFPSVEVRGFERPGSTVERVLALGDGQEFAELAAHPEIRVDRFKSGPGGAAYRASRPLWSWLTRAAALGRPDWVPYSMVILAFASAILLLLVLSVEVGNWAIAILFVPGIVVALSWLTPETLGLALTLVGLAGGGIGWFLAAGLLRESFLIVPGVRYLQTRNPKYLIPFGAWLAWVAIVVLRTGALPVWNDDASINAGLPFVGIAHALSRWGTGEVVAACIVATSAVLAIRRYPLMVSAHLAFATLMGWGVWQNWLGFTRPLVVLHALALVASHERIHRTRYEASRPSATWKPTGNCYRRVTSEDKCEDHRRVADAATDEEAQFEVC